MDATYATFEFSGWELDGRVLRLGYRFTDGAAPNVSFEEVLRLPPTLDAPNASDPAVRRAADIAHFTFGVSYYKAFCPRNVVARPVPEAAAEFWDTLYSEGLGEFYFKNGIDPRGRVRFARGAEGVERAAHLAPARERALVLVGGGKDSVVAREVLRHAGVECDAFSLGTATWIERSAAAMGLRHHVIERALDPRLFELNARGALNGHVPISACIAAAGSLLAVANGYTAVIAANERSADEGNTSFNGIEINHQWSKSFRFEQAFRALGERLLENAPLYLSILRPLSELSIARLFTRHPAYHTATSSCNKNFRIREPVGERRWCGQCPKCVFVYLIVAAHADADVLRRIFGSDFLADAQNFPLLADLAGVGGIKPFECVGTPVECRAALGRLHASGRLAAATAAWYESAVGVDPARAAAEWTAAMTPATSYPLPPVWQSRLDAYLRAH
ncbi:MAG TPA: hypothetical protein VMI54_17665 [Polyangiaceae bacterium]|nr:hypothetical protein [Polyangiaceae bacterium]